ncbi:MAG: DUF354 domain-containing protein [Nanoarchaeota archaeon]|nr:DUF354 domain-containing protein [Nanoarchaeota archaeon]
MRILIEINHPAQVHKLKNLIKQLQKNHQLLILSRDKDVTLSLLKAYQIKSKCISKQPQKKFLLPFELLQRLSSSLYYTLKFKPQLMLGFSAINICLIGRLLRIKTILYADTEDAGWISKLTFPYAQKIFIPATFKRKFGKRELRFQGTHELSYLMNFNPNQSIYKLLKIKPNQKYVILRFISWQASHDTKESGLSYHQKIKLINLLKKKFKIFISSEKPLSKYLQQYQLTLPPHRIHEAMYHAEMFIGESQSMATEAGLMGTPSVRFSSLVGKMHGLGQYLELEKEGIVYSIKDEEEFFKRIIEIINLKNRKTVWKKRKQKYLQDKINPVEIMINNIQKK